MSTRQKDLQQANIEALAANERLALALEATGLSVWDWDIPSGSIQFQPSISEMLGYPCVNGPTHLEGRNLTHPDDIPIFDREFHAHVSGQKPRIDAEFRMQHYDGSWHWIHCRGEIVARNDDGSPLRVVGTFADVTDRHDDQADRQFLSDMTLGMVQARDPASVVSVAIQKLAKYLMAERVGISELADDGKTFMTRSVWSHHSLPPAPSNHRTGYMPDLIERCLAGTLVIEDVCTDPLMDDPVTQELYAGMGIRSVINVPMRAEGRNPLFLFVHARAPRSWKPREVLLSQQVAERLWDSINRASAEGVKETADELLSMAFAVAKIGAFERNLHNGTVSVSKDFFKVIGHPEIESGSLVDYLTIIHEDDRARFAAKIAAAREKRVDYEAEDEHRILTSTGEVRHIAYKSRTHYEKDEHGVNRLVRAAAIVQDITEQKKQNLETAAARDRLHKMSRLTAMGTMASTLAHELNQPLTAAANYLSVLKTLEQSGRTMPDIDRSEVLELAIRKVLDAGKIIKKIRSFTNDGDPHRTSVFLRAIIDRAVAGLADLNLRKPPEVTIQIPQKLTVVADEMQIEQVLNNLIRNAAEAMRRQKDGHIKIAVTQEDGFVVIHVCDNGPGIPDDFARELFNPFQSSKRTGLGLGLSLCRTMVEAHGGYLTLEKHDKTGCDFVIRLPQAARKRRAN